MAIQHVTVCVLAGALVCWVEYDDTSDTLTSAGADNASALPATLTVGTLSMSIAGGQSVSRTVPGSVPVTAVNKWLSNLPYSAVLGE